MKNSNAMEKGIVTLCIILFVYGMLIMTCINVFDNRYFSTKQGQTMSIDDIESEYLDNLWLKRLMINFNGNIGQRLNMKSFYNDSNIYVSENGYTISCCSKTTTDYEVDQIGKFKSYLDEKEIYLLYVNAPIKYLDDLVVEKEFYVSSYANRNADLFLQRLSELNINYIDLRQDIVKEHRDILSMFYRTDHHWTTQTGLWATQKVAAGLNQYCDYDIDIDTYDESNYVFTEFKNSWLGEQGSKVGRNAELDDYMLIKPKFTTNLRLTTLSEVQEGDFSILLDEARLYTGKNTYGVGSYHYTYLPRGLNQISIHNNDVSYGKVLVLADSFSQCVIPFLALEIKDISVLLLREYKGNLRDYIEKGQFDTVIILYSEPMIGAHDNTVSSNYRMFDFE